MGDHREEARASVPGARGLTAVERTLLDAFLAHDFPGVEELRAQARQATASQGCACGCGTVDLQVSDDLPRSVAESPVPVEGTVVGAGGEPTGGLLLFVEEGRLAGLEVYSFDGPLPLPRVEQVRWSRA